MLVLQNRNILTTLWILITALLFCFNLISNIWIRLTTSKNLFYLSLLVIFFSFFLSYGLLKVNIFSTWIRILIFILFILSLIASPTTSAFLRDFHF